MASPFRHHRSLLAHLRASPFLLLPAHRAQVVVQAGLAHASTAPAAVRVPAAEELLQVAVQVALQAVVQVAAQAVVQVAVPVARVVQVDHAEAHSDEAKKANVVVASAKNCSRRSFRLTPRPMHLSPTARSLSSAVPPLKYSARS